ncbi:MAG: formylglycine-generating enzyme family protein [Actinomycetota bacterium]
MARARAVIRRLSRDSWTPAFAGVTAWALLAALPAAAEPKSFSACADCPPMVVVPAGRFVMGDDASPFPNERPAREVAIDRPFALMRTEVTFDQWQACVQAGACRRTPDDHGWGRGKRPVVNVTWDEARAFAAWIGAKARRTCRLPTEAEWEYAARAGTASAYWWGDDAGLGHAVCRGCLEGETENYGTKPAASLPANPWGLYDTAGNVWEWTSDCWTASHAEAPPAGTCSERVIKGGSWYYFAPMSRPAARARQRAGEFSYVLGLRVLCELP